MLSRAAFDGILDGLIVLAVCRAVLGADWFFVTWVAIGLLAKLVRSSS